MEKWEILISGQPYTIDFDTLVEWIRQGKVSQTDMAHVVGETWSPAGKHPLLQSYFPVPDADVVKSIGMIGIGLLVVIFLGVISITISKSITHKPIKKEASQPVTRITGTEVAYQWLTLLQQEKYPEADKLWCSGFGPRRFKKVQFGSYPDDFWEPRTPSADSIDTRVWVDIRYGNSSTIKCRIEMLELSTGDINTYCICNLSNDKGESIGEVE